MKISIFTSTFNRKENLARMIDSIKSQSYKNWELFIVDDGSDDGTEEIFKSFKDERINYIKFDINRGHPVAIYKSKILEKLSGEIITFIGSDDYFKKNIFETIVRVFKNESDKVWKIGFFFDYEDGSVHRTLNDVKEYKFLSNEIMSDKYVQSDYLFFYRSNFWNEFVKYFSLPKDFFRSFYDVAMKNPYIEKINKIVVLTAGWGNDNITKGNNSAIYFKWSLYTRVYLYENYKKNMGKIFYRYTLNSLIRNLLLVRGNRLKVVKYIILKFKDLIKDVFDIFIWIILLITPKAILLNIKKILFKRKKHR